MQDIQIADEKLSILYFLSLFDFPVKIHFITGFFTDEDILDYFFVQQLLSELTSSTLVSKEEDNETGLMTYTLTSDGFSLLDYFSDRVLPYVKEHADAFAINNRLKMQSDAQVTANYDKTDDGLFHVHLNLHELDFPLIDITLTAVSREQAKHMCDQWLQQAPDIYNIVLNRLISQN